MNYGALAKPLGFFLGILAIALVVPFTYAISEDAGLSANALSFLGTICIVLCLGAGLWIIGRRNTENLQRKEGLLFVSVAWIMAGILGAMPFVFSGVIPSPLNAIFESISGFTTTGASILTDIEALPKSMLLWRSLTHWLGGMGIVVLFVAILPALGIGGKHLYRIEATGPSVSGLHARTKDTARTLWLIYTGISLVEFLFLWIGGMPAFDAVCHVFGTMATGGFSTKNASIAYYGSYFHVIITIFMFMCGVNFSLYYQALKGKWLFWKDAEFRLYAALTGVAVLILLGSQIYQDFAMGTISPFGIKVRDSFFVATTILTTTGYGTADFEQWTTFAQGTLVALMFIGGSAGSTGGGMKVVRILITVRWAWKNLLKAISPHSIVPLRVGGVAVEPEIEDQVVGFFLLFMMWFGLGIAVMLICGHDLVTSVTASIASVANIGPGLGMIGPTENYAMIHPVAKAFLAILMLVGRLEVLAISVLVVPSFWKR